MRFLHSSDWHLGATEGDRYLLEDQRFFIDEICKILIEQKADALLLAGDVFDRAVSSADAIKLYDYAMTRICRDIGVPVIAVAGNHDGSERLASCRELLEASGLHLLGSLEETPKIVSFADTDVYLIPWITEEKVKYLFPSQKEQIGNLTDAYRVVTDRMRSSFVPGKRHFAVAHAYITDSETSGSDRSAEIGFAAQVDASVFDGFDYVALGHLHKPQDVNDRIRYSGTPMPYAFGKEETQEKSVTLIDSETLERKTIALPLLHRRTTLEGRLDDLLSPSCDEDVRNGYIRLRVNDSYVGLETLSELKRCYPNLLEVSSQLYDHPDSSVTLTTEQLEELESDPIEVFRFFCQEEVGTEPDEHLLELFRQAVEKAEEANV